MDAFSVHRKMFVETPERVRTTKSKDRITLVISSGYQIGMRRIPLFEEALRMRGM